MKALLTLLFPSHRFISNDSFVRIYKDFPDEEASFRNCWLDARLAISNDIRTPEFEATLSLPTNLPPAVFVYNYVLELVEAPIGIFNRPSYYNDGTNAMLYGGLGFFLASGNGARIGQRGDSLAQEWKEQGVAFFERASGKFRG
ncbi:hypothetical protein MTO96_008075 [Rhipicephalus appendiculatus]